MKKVFAYALSQKKNIILISDMYLPKAFIGKLLEKGGYKGYKALFIPNEYKCNKGTGKLYHNGRYIFKISTNLEAKAIRVDPTEGHLLFISKPEVKINGVYHRFKISQYRGLPLKLGGIINSKDPQLLIIPKDKQIKEIAFSAKMKILR